jgi:chaperonin GroEL (HSP60 family)
MYKMLAEEARPFDLTRDGSSVITGLVIKHPAARLIVEMAKAMDDEVGDGTTSSIILAGELVKRAERLIHDGLHPVTISSGYKMAAERAKQIMEEVLAVEVGVSDRVKVANTALKLNQSDLAHGIVKSVELTRPNLDLSSIKIDSVEGGELEDTRLIEGSILHNWVVPGSPKHVEDARILVLRNPVMVERATYLSNINISTSDLGKHFEKEEEILRRMADKICDIGASVVICMKEIDVRAKDILSSHGILSVEKIAKYEYVRHLCLATGANLVTDIFSASQNDLGYAAIVEGDKVAEEEIVFFEGCKNASACTFLVRGGTEKIAKEHKRAVYAAVHSVASSFVNPKILPGGGAVEVELAKGLRKFANSLQAKEQLAALAFADALEIIPKMLAINSGLDPIDAVVEMRSSPGKGVCIGEETMIGNTLENGIVDPLGVKEYVLSSAVEIAELVLLTDGMLKDRRRADKEKNKK